MRLLAPALACLVLLGGALAEPSSAATLPGVNLSGAEFHGGSIYPSIDDVRWYAAQGFKLIRLPVNESRVQPTQFGDLNPKEVKAIDAIMAAAKIAGAQVIIDAHNFGALTIPDGTTHRFGTPEVPIATLIDFWTRVGKRYPDAWLDLQNEPSNASDVWAALMQQTVTALRAAGIHNTLLIEGTRFSNAGVWVKVVRTPSIDFSSAIDKLNGGKGIVDPDRNYMYSPHIYLDRDGSGQHAACAWDYGVLVRATEWARARQQKMVLGEFAYGSYAGVPASCAKYGPNTLAYMRANDDVWAGYTIYGGGRAWVENYIYKVEPHKGTRATVQASDYLRQITGGGSGGVAATSSPR